MWEILKRLFASDEFMPHGHCYLWKPALVWLHVVSDALIALSYTTIPVTLIYFVRRRRDLPFNWMFVCFGMFIVACGATHYMEIWTLWTPTYWLSGVVKAITAAASVPTAYLLVRLIPSALQIPRPSELQEAEGRFRELVESAPDAMVIINSDDKIDLVNTQTELLFGYPRDELLGKTVEMLIPERYREQYLDHRTEYFDNLKARSMRASLELYGVRKDNTEFPIEISLSPLQTPDGILVSSAIRDITGRKQAEENARRLDQEQAARAAAEEAVAIRDDFVAMAGHELRTPLATLLMQLQSVQRLVRKDPTANISERLAKAERSGLRLEKLISQLLDMSRIAAGRLSLEPEPFNLADLLKEVVTRFAEASVAANSPIAVYAEAAVNGVWDRERIDQIITNLVSNAVKYGRGKPIEVGLSVESGRAVLTVTDHGIGIDTTHQEKIFQRFERAVAAREFGGIGLGLWITRQIIEATGGTIEVNSAPACGATFHVRLPMRPKDDVLSV